MFTVPVPTFSGEATTRSACSQVRPTTPPTTSTMESTAPTSWKWTSAGLVPWTEASASASRRNSRALLQAHVSTGAEHEVIEDLDPHQLPRRRETVRQRHVFRGWLRVARGMVVEEDEGRGPADHRLLEHLPRMDQAGREAPHRHDG